MAAIGAKRPFAYEPNAGTRAFSADTILLTSSIVTVIGPTAPGAGVTNEVFAERLRNRRRPRAGRRMLASITTAPRSATITDRSKRRG